MAHPSQKKGKTKQRTADRIAPMQLQPARISGYSWEIDHDG